MTPTHKAIHTLTVRVEKYLPTGKTISRRYGSATQYTETHKETRQVIRTLEGRVVLTIDIDAIVNRLGYRAIVNKSGKAVGLNGLIQVRRLDSKELSRIETPVRPLTGEETYADTSTPNA